MTGPMIRTCTAAALALIALGGAIVLEAVGEGTPDWLVWVISAAVGYAFGHVQANGINGKKSSGSA